MEFYMVDMESPYNVILGRSWLHMIKVVLSTYHQLVQYPTMTGTANIRGDQVTVRTISVVAQKKSS